MQEPAGTTAATAENPGLTAELRKMWDLASRLRQQRFKQGALDLDFPETKVRLDPDGRPLAIEKIEYDISHQLIEEFMLAANEAAARHISGRQIPCIYRIHEDPDEDKLVDFRVYAQGFGYQVGDLTHRRELQKLLAHVHGTPEEYAVQLALLRSLKQARYSPQPSGHYGLSKKFYLHFTSPIRRYADLVVHRTLRRMIGGDAQRSQDRQPGALKTYRLAELTTISEHISRTERVSDEAEKESVELKKMELFHHQLMTGQLDVMEAVVCGVRNFGLFVELPDSLMQGLVRISTLEDDFYHYEEQHERLVGRRTGRVIHIGHKLKVQVEKVDVFKRQIDFRVVPDESTKPATSPGKKPVRQKKRRRSRT